MADTPPAAAPPSVPPSAQPATAAGPDDGVIKSMDGIVVPLPPSGDEAPTGTVPIPAAASSSAALAPAATPNSGGGITGTTTPLQSAKTVLASTEGSNLRRIARDVDSPKLLLQLTTPAARRARHLAVGALVDALTAPRAAGGDAAGGIAAAGGGASGDWPKTDAAAAQSRRQAVRFDAVTALLLRMHARKILTAGWRAPLAVLAAVWLGVRIGVAALVRALPKLIIGGRCFGNCPVPVDGTG